MRWIRILWSNVRPSRILRAVAISVSLAGLVAYMAIGSNFSLSNSSRSTESQNSPNTKDKKTTSVTTATNTKVPSNFQDCSVSAATNNVGTCILTNPNLNITSYSISYVFTPSTSGSSVGSLSISLPESLVPNGLSVNSYIWICTSSSSLASELSGSAAYCATGGTSGRVFSTSGPVVAGSGSSATATYTFPLPYPAPGDLFWMLHFDANNGDTLEVAPSVSVSVTSSTATAYLALSKTEAPSSPNPVTKAGQSVTYDFVVTNTGNTTLNNLAITDTQSVPGEALNGPISCPVTSLAATASVTCTGSYTVTSADISNGKVSDTAIATASSNGSTITSSPSSLTILVNTGSSSTSPTTKSSSTSPTTKSSSTSPTTKSSSTNNSGTTGNTGSSSTSPTTSSNSTSPAPVQLVTGPLSPPSSSTDALPIGLGITGLGLAGLGYLLLERKRRLSSGNSNEVA